MKTLIFVLGILLATLVTLSASDDRFEIKTVSLEMLVDDEWEVVYDKEDASGLLILNGRRMTLYLDDSILFYDQISDLTEDTYEEFARVEAMFIDNDGDKARVEIYISTNENNRRMMVSVNYSNARIYWVVEKLSK